MELPDSWFDPDDDGDYHDMEDEDAVLEPSHDGVEEDDTDYDSLDCWSYI